MSFDIFFNKIVVKKSSSNSGVVIGKNSAKLWRVYSKKQAAIDVPKNTFIWNSKFYISDRDVIDFYVDGRK